VIEQEVEVEVLAADLEVDAAPSRVRPRARRPREWSPGFVHDLAAAILRFIAHSIGSRLPFVHDTGRV
jgi:hypothetical protein